MDSPLDLELKQLMVGTNDQRRRVGQVVFHLYRTLIFWHDKGRGFQESVRAWSEGGAAMFDTLATTLEALGGGGNDVLLRAWLAEVLGQLAEDLERGDPMLMGFLRWLESRFPDLTKMMQEEQAGSTKLYDLELARSLTRVFTLAAGAGREEMVKLFGTEAEALSPSRRRARPAGPRT